jgi:long-subunit fatty acid transport protein
MANISRAALCGGLLTGALLASPARAALTDNLATSPAAMSMGNAVTADPNGLDAVHFNPAALTHLKGRVKSDTFFGAKLRVASHFSQPDGFDIGGFKNDPLDGSTSEHNHQSIFLPVIGSPKARLPVAVAAGLGFAFNEPGSPWTYATATYVPQAVGIDRTANPDDPARFDGRKVVIQRLVYLSPAVGYKVSDTFSVGVAVPIAHQGFALDTDMRFPNQLIGIMGKLQDAWCGDNGNPLDAFGLGLCGGGQAGRLNPFGRAGNMRFEATAPADPTLNVGVLWEPEDWFGLGAVYQSGAKTVLTGRYNFHADPMFRKFVEGMYASLLGPIAASTFGFPASIPENQSGNVTLVLPFPAHAQVGLKIKPLSRLQLNLDAMWTDWGQWNQLVFQFDQNVKLLEMARLFGQSDPSKLVIPRGYKSNVHYGVGLQFAVSDRLKLRLGYEPRKTSVPSDKMDLIAPLPDLNVKSLGASFTTAQGTRIDLGFSSTTGRYNLPANTSCNLNCTNFFNVIYNPYAGLDVSGSIRIRYAGVTLTHPF